MTLDWFVSKTVRHATAMRRHVEKLLNHQRDILSPQAIEAVQASTASLSKALGNRADKSALEKEMKDLEAVANKWLKPYPHAAWRENIEVLLVALAVAMGIRTFFLQPFKIPTGSMQPTLYGVTSANLINEPRAQIPKGLDRVKEWFQGNSYVNVVAKNDGELMAVHPPVRFLIFNILQRLQIGNQVYTIWFPPDYGSSTLEARANLHYRQPYRKGDDIVKLRVTSGDHLFVDRVTYNFRTPERGEIIVFETKGIPDEMRIRAGIPPDQFYIKRLVGLGGETIQIGDDRHLIVNGKRLEASMPHFEKVYGFNPSESPQDSHYSGHVRNPFLAPFFEQRQGTVEIPKGHYMAMGDNTMNSLDSRAWGYFPANYVIGKSFFVYWPLTERFGWGYHR